LVDLANLRGGPDNITVIVVEVTEHESVAGKPRMVTPTFDAVPWPIVGSAVFCAIAGTMLGLGGNIGPMIVALILAGIATVISILQYRRRVRWDVANSQPGNRSSTHRSGPYRTCSAKPTVRLLEKLDQVLAALKTAAVQRNWEVDWKLVDGLISQEQELRRQGKLALATQVQAQAIIATMKQLRNQQRSNERG
jgi:protein phosphatase